MDVIQENRMYAEKKGFFSILFALLEDAHVVSTAASQNPACSNFDDEYLGCLFDNVIKTILTKSSNVASFSKDSIHGRLYGWMVHSGCYEALIGVRTSARISVNVYTCALYMHKYIRKSYMYPYNIQRMHVSILKCAHKNDYVNCIFSAADLF